MHLLIPPRYQFMHGDDGMHKGKQLEARISSAKKH
jgi:hypothetical protein